jgi:hypothetical protein
MQRKIPRYARNDNLGGPARVNAVAQLVTQIEREDAKNAKNAKKNAMQ